MVRLIIPILLLVIISGCYPESMKQGIGVSIEAQKKILSIDPENQAAKDTIKIQESLFEITGRPEMALPYTPAVAESVSKKISQDAQDFEYYKTFGSSLLTGSWATLGTTVIGAVAYFLERQRRRKEEELSDNCMRAGEKIKEKVGTGLTKDQVTELFRQQIPQTDYNRKRYQKVKK